MPEQDVKIYPAEGTSSAPVNTVITISIDGNTGIDPDDLKAGKFHLSSCPKEEPEPPTADTTDKDDDKNEPEPIAKANVIPFVYKVLHDGIDQSPQDEQATEGVQDSENEGEESSGESTEEKTRSEAQSAPGIKGVLVLLIPKTHEGETPLKPDTTYCVTSDPIRTSSNKILARNKVQFKTERVESFMFSAQATPEADLQDAIAKDQDFIVLDFYETSVPATKLMKHITVCEKRISQVATTGPCKNYGGAIEFELFMIEDMVRKEGQSQNTFTSNLFTVTPTMSADTEEIKLFIDPNLGESSEPGNSSVSKTMKVVDVEDRVGQSILSSITEAQNTHYVSFRIGVKTQ